MTSLVQKTCEKDVVGIVTFVPDWFFSHQSHNCFYYNGIPEFLRRRSMLKVKLLKQSKILKFHWQKVESTRNSKLRQLSGRFQTLIWRPGEAVQIGSLPDYPTELTSLQYVHLQWIQLWHGSHGPWIVFENWKVVGYPETCYKSTS